MIWLAAFRGTPGATAQLHLPTGSPAHPGSPHPPQRRTARRARPRQAASSIRCRNETKPASCRGPGAPANRDKGEHVMILTDRPRRRGTVVVVASVCLIGILSV